MDDTCLTYTRKNIMNTGGFCFIRFCLVAKWLFLSGWRTLAGLTVTLCLTMIFVSGLVVLGVFGQRTPETMTDTFGNFAAGILLGVVFVGGVKASEHIRKKNSRREILMMPTSELEKALAISLFNISILPLTAFVGLKAGMLAFKGIMSLLEYSIGDADILFALQVDTTANATMISSVGISDVEMGTLQAILLLIWWYTASLFAGMFFRKAYYLCTVPVWFIEMIFFPLVAVIFREELFTSEYFRYVLQTSMSVFWTIINLLLAYRVYLNTEIAEHGLTRRLF